MPLSFSQITLHRKCPQAWFYRYNLRLERMTLGPTVARDFGTLWHVIMAADSIERGRATETLKYSPPFVTVGPLAVLEGDDITVDNVFDAIDFTWRGLSTDDKEVWLEFLGIDFPTRLRDLYLAWRDRWAEERENEEVIAVEVPWTRTMPNGKVLMGVIDEVFRNIKRNMTVVRDHKSKKQLAAATTIEDMMDSQLQFYGWGITELLIEWGVPPVRATAYDRVRSKAPRMPALTLTGGLSKSITDYDLDTYLTWAAGPDGEGVPWGEEGVYYVSGAKKGEPKFGLYQAEDSVIEKLSSPAARTAWFQRTLTPLNRMLIQTHLGAAVDTSDDIERSQARVDEKGEAARNLTPQGCKFCDFADLCRAQMYGGPRGEYDFAEYGLVSTRDTIDDTSIMDAEEEMTA